MLKMNLQTFADGGQQAEGVNDQSFKDKVMSFLNGQTSPEPQGQVAPTPQEGAPATADNVPVGEGELAPGNQPEGVQSAQPTPDNNGLILGKFKSPDEVVSAYANLEKFNTQTRQELAQSKQAIDELTAVVQQMQQGANGEANPEAVPVQGNTEMDAEDFMNLFYENPQEALKNLINSQLDQTIKPQIEPIVQREQAATKQAEWDNLVGQFASEHDDFGNFKTEMQTILDSHPELGEHPNGIDFIYNMAKGQKYQDPTQLLQDDNYLNQILGNDDVVQKIVSQYMQGVNKGERAPVLISGQPGGNMQLAPENKPKNMEEAKSMARRMFGM